MHRCLNRDCPAQIKASIWHFSSRDAMDIDGLGRRTVSLLVDKGLLKSVADLYRLGVEDMENLPGLGKKSAYNLISALEISKEVTLPRFLFALGIYHVGSHLAQLLADHFNSLDCVRKATREELEKVPGVGEKVAFSVEHYFGHPSNRRLIDELLDLGISLKTPAVAPRIADTFWQSKVVVFTGSLSSLTRQEAGALVGAKGATVINSVSGNTDIVVAGKEAGSKLDKAIRLGVTILNEEEFLERTGRSNIREP